MIRGCAVVILALSAVMGLRAQVTTAALSTVRGAVVDDKGLVMAADVRLLRDGTGRTLATISDDLGRFEFRDVAEGSWTLVVRRIGYSEYAEPLVVRARESRVVRVTLKSTPRTLDTIAVVGKGAVPARYGPSSRMDEFYRRRARGRGRFFTREDIEDSGRSKLTDLLRVVPGARVRTSLGNLAEVGFARCSGPARLTPAAATGGIPLVALYVNGARVDTASLRQTLSELELGEIEAIEVYRGVSELPMEAVGNACSAIFVWTRFGPGSQ